MPDPSGPTQEELEEQYENPARALTLGVWIVLPLLVTLSLAG